MPTARVNGVEIHYEARGQASASATIVFSHGLLWSAKMFESQLRALESEYRVIAWDHRGQGRSPSPDERSHQIESCYHDALALLDQLEIETCHFVGLSMGGFVGMRLAARHPSRVSSLSLLATAADPEPRANLPKYQRLNAVAKRLGTRPVARAVMPIMFGRTFLTDDSRATERERWTNELRGCGRQIYRAVNGVIERERCTDELANIRCPTLVLHGDEDAAISRSRALLTYQAIAGATFQAIEAAGHTMTVENPDAVTAALRGFVAGVIVRDRG